MRSWDSGSRRLVGLHAFPTIIFSTFPHDITSQRNSNCCHFLQTTGEEVPGTDDTEVGSILRLGESGATRSGRFLLSVLVRPQILTPVPTAEKPPKRRLPASPLLREAWSRARGSRARRGHAPRAGREGGAGGPGRTGGGARGSRRSVSGTSPAGGSGGECEPEPEPGPRSGAGGGRGRAGAALDWSADRAWTPAVCASPWRSR